MKEIPLGELRRVRVPRPPRDEQATVAALMNIAAEAERRERAGVSALQSVKAGLLQDLLTGKVRVSV